MAARRTPKVFAGPALSPADQLLSAMRTVKAARFNAAERLERKNTLSMFSMSIVSLYFVGLSVWQVVYAPLLDEPTNRLVTLVSIMSSIFTLVLALIESMNDYKIKAHHMHTCALAVNDLYHEFKLAPPGDDGRVQEFRRRYNEIGARLPAQSCARRLPDGACRAGPCRGRKHCGCGCATSGTCMRSMLQPCSSPRWSCCCAASRAA